MAKIKAEEMSGYDPELVELMVEYKKGWANLENTVRDMGKLTGLTPEVCKALLRSIKRNNVTQIRGYSKEPQRLLEAKARKRKQEP